MLDNVKSWNGNKGFVTKNHIQLRMHKDIKMPTFSFSKVMNNVSGTVPGLTALYGSGSVPVLSYNDMFISQQGSPCPDTNIM
jgi:hypothetical protein